MRKRIRKDARAPLVAHWVRCPSCTVWYRATRREYGLWWLPPHTVAGTAGGYVRYADGSTCTHSSWCRDSARPVWDQGLRRPGVKREEMSRATG